MRAKLRRCIVRNGLSMSIAYSATNQMAHQYLLVFTPAKLSLPPSSSTRTGVSSEITLLSSRSHRICSSGEQSWTGRTERRTYNRPATWKWSTCVLPSKLLPKSTDVSVVVKLLWHTVLFTIPSRCLKSLCIYASLRT